MLATPRPGRSEWGLVYDFYKRSSGKSPGSPRSLLRSRGEKVADVNAAIKRTPLYAIAQGLGARFTDQQGWQLPAVYSDVEAEIAAARQSVVLSDTTPNGKLMVEGAEAEAVLRANFDVSVLEVGMGALVGTDRVYRLRKDLFFVSTPPGGQDRVQKTRKIYKCAELAYSMIWSAALLHRARCGGCASLPQARLRWGTGSTPRARSW